MNAMTATVVPKFVNDPKPGKTNYSVKDENNVLWSVKPGDIHKFAKGQATAVEYTVFQGNNGFTMNMVERADAPQVAPQAPQQAAAYAPAPPAYGNQHRQAPEGAQPPASPAAASRAVTQDENIFVTGIVGRAMGSGNFSVEDIPTLTAAAVQAFRNWQA